jgi:hypothetical protein
MTDNKPNPVNKFEDANKAQDEHAREIEIINLKHKNEMELATHRSAAYREAMATYREAIAEYNKAMAAYREAMAEYNKG